MSAPELEFSKRFAGLPYSGAEAVVITSVDHVFATTPVRNLIITGDGDVVVVLQDGTSLTMPVVITGSSNALLFPGNDVLIKQVTKTGTTATVLAGLF